MERTVLPKLDGDASKVVKKIVRFFRRDTLSTGIKRAGETEKM